MSFIRPEAATQILRWREAIIGTGLLIPGLWWAFAGTGLMPYIGGALIILGALLIFVGIQRARFRIPGNGPGIVQVTEDQVTYFGPLTGGAVALSDLTHLSAFRAMPNPPTGCCLNPPSPTCTSRSPPTGPRHCLTPSPGCPPCAPNICWRKCTPNPPGAS